MRRRDGRIRGVHVGCLVADDLDVAKALAQARALQLRRLVQQIPLCDEHQRPRRRQRRQRLATAGNSSISSVSICLGERNRSAQVGAGNPAAREIDRRLDQREREARHAVTEELEVGELGLVDMRLDLVRGELDARAGQQPSKPLAPVAIAALVVPERVVAVERDEIEGTSAHSFSSTVSGEIGAVRAHGGVSRCVLFDLSSLITFDHPRRASRAHAVVLSVWQVVHGFGILYSSVIAGVMNLNVWLRTFTSRDRLLDLRHVAGDALAAGAAARVMRVLLRCVARVRPVRRPGAVAREAQIARRLDRDRRCSPCRARRGS